jgi:hypothetical protein
MNHFSRFHSNAVWPPAAFVTVFALAYAILSGAIWLIQKVAPFPESSSDFPDLVRMQAIVLAIPAGCYAIYRLARFHPAFNPKYAAWLRLSPWTSRRPLPLGPVHLVWQDLVVVGSLSAIAGWHVRANPALPMAAFAFAYLGAMTLVLAFTRRWSHCVILGFLWPALALPWAKGWPAVGLVAAAAAVVWHGHRQSLCAFPWPFLAQPARTNETSPLDVQIRVGGPGALYKSTNLGWPYRQLSPKADLGSVTVSAGLCLSLLFGWWTYCGVVGTALPAAPELILPFALIAAFVRLGIYATGVTAPFNLRGRIGSGRLLIPGFDKIFLTPIAVVILAIVGSVIIRRSGSWYPEAESATVAITWFAVFSGGPTLRNWLLTGQVRFPGPTLANKLSRPI